MITVLVPTRGREEALRKSVDSLTNNASDLVEILVRYDHDELDHNYCERFKPHVQEYCFTGPRHGYKNLHMYYNELAKKAKGDWLLLWNDDALMQTKGWDTIIEAHEPKFVLNPQTNHKNHEKNQIIFPIVPRKFVRELGHFSLNAHCDTWWEEIGNKLGIVKNVPIYILHDRADLTGNNDDQTYRERAYCTDSFFGDVMIRARQEDIEKLRLLL